MTSLENDLRKVESTELLPKVSTELRPVGSSFWMSTEYLPLAVNGLGTGLDTVEFAVEGSSNSISLAELGGRDVKGFSAI